MVIRTIPITEYLDGLESGLIDPLHNVEKILYGRRSLATTPKTPEDKRVFEVVKAVHP